jgi:hypothetical protein
MRLTFDDFVDGEVTDASLNCTLVARWMSHRVRVGRLCSAHIAAFAALGHRYVMRPTLDVVREQVQRPETDLLPDAAVQVPDGPAHGRGWTPR